MAGAIEKAEELKQELGNAFIPAQFDNPANWQAHYRTTGPELYAELDGKIDCFIAGVGTGGTITGTGKYLKEKNPAVKIIAVEPASSPLLSGGKAGPHKIQGIGANFIPSVLDQEIYDEVADISDEDALTFGAMFGKTEGVLCGISAGAALCAAIREAQKEENSGKNIVVLLTDGGDRYLSSEMFG
jgi:cysteine synthase A